MRQEESLRTQIHDALDQVVRPAPSLVVRVMERVRAEAPVPTKRSLLTRLVRATALLAAAAVVMILAITFHQATNRGEAPAHTAGPIFVPPTAATGLGGQVAWLQGQAGLTGVDSSGHILGRIQASEAQRSADGSVLYAIAGQHVDTYDAATGKLERMIARQAPGNVTALTASRHYLVILYANPAGLEVVDLTAGRSAAYTRLGTAFPDSGPQFVLVASDGSRLFAFAGFWQHTAVVVLRFDGSTLRIDRQVIDGQQGHSVPSCNGMASDNAVTGLPERLLPDSQTMASFCPGDGVVSLFDLNRLTISAQLRVPERNPFWLSPVFSRDGSMLYVHEPGTGRVTVVDLQRRTIVRSAIVEAPTASNALRWLADRLFSPAFAGGIPRSAAVSPDGAYLYVTGAFDKPIGVAALRLYDFRVSGQWSLQGGGSLWLSSDGGTVYALNNGGDHLSILQLDRASVTVVKLSPPGYDFLALSPT